MRLHSLRIAFTAFAAFAALAGAFPAAAQTPIHDIQGSGVSSPVNGQSVIVRGIVTGRRGSGYFLQAPDAEADADPATSEGVFVFTSTTPSATASLGNLVQVVGTVQEFIPSGDPLSPSVTQIAQTSVSLLSSGNPLPTAVTLTAAMTSPSGAHDQLERFEGMLVTVPRLTVVGPTQGTINEATSGVNSTGVFFGVVEGVARPFREPGIPSPDPAPIGYGSVPPIPRWDGDPELLRIASSGLVGSPALNVSSGATITGMFGPLDYVNRRYTIFPHLGAVVESDTRQPIAVPIAQSDQYTVGNLNAQRFFNAVSDGNSAPIMTATAYDVRLGKLSRVVRDVMRSPDIIAVQEVEKLSTLQALAARISADALQAGQTDPLYASYLVDGNSPLGLSNGFLVKTALDGGQPRVNVTSVTQLFAGTTITSPGGIQTLLFERPPLELVASVRTSSGLTQALTVLNVQMRTASDITSTVADPDWGTAGNQARTRRYQQAVTIADRLQALQTNPPDPARGILLTGEFSTPEFNDGYGDLIGVLRGAPAPDDQTAMPNDGADLVTPDYTDLTETVSATERYQTVVNGVAQASQHILISRSLLLNTTSRQQFLARTGADFAETLRGVATTAARAIDTDPLVTYFTPGAALSVAPGAGMAFGVRSVSPNPARGAIGVRFVARAGSDARLELFDLAGRRVESHEVASPSGAEQQVRLAEGRVLRPGVYQVRLTQGERSESARVLVVR